MPHFARGERSAGGFESCPDTFSIILGSIFHRSQKIDISCSETAVPCDNVARIRGAITPLPVCLLSPRDHPSPWEKMRLNLVQESSSVTTLSGIMGKLRDDHKHDRISFGSPTASTKISVACCNVKINFWIDSVSDFPTSEQRTWCSWRSCILGFAKYSYE